MLVNSCQKMNQQYWATGIFGSGVKQDNYGFSWSLAIWWQLHILSLRYPSTFPREKHTPALRSLYFIHVYKAYGRIMQVNRLQLIISQGLSLLPRRTLFVWKRLLVQSPWWADVHVSCNNVSPSNIGLQAIQRAAGKFAQYFLACI